MNGKWLEMDKWLEMNKYTRFPMESHMTSAKLSKYQEVVEIEVLI